MPSKREQEELRKRYERAQDLRYKRPALMSLGWEHIQNEMEEIVSECNNIQYMSQDEELYETLNDTYWDLDRKGLEFDDCLVSLVGNRYQLVGFDSMEEDYFRLTSWDSQLAESEAGKRLMRQTKADMLSTIGQCVGIALAFLDIRYRYDYLKATFGVLKDDKTSILQMVREVERVYEILTTGLKLSKEYRDAEREWDKLMQQLPQRVFLE